MLLAIVATVLPLALDQLHCATGAGFIAALTSDDTYQVALPADGPPHGSNPEQWTKVDSQNLPASTAVAVNSLTGSYMQVLPDDHDSYHDINGPASFTMTGLRYRLRVTTAGLHTLFLRWTGGDTVGGGDSLYAVMYDSEDNIVSGPPTYKPKQEGINSGRYAGCCYNMVTRTPVASFETRASFLCACR